MIYHSLLLFSNSTPSGDNTQNDTLPADAVQESGISTNESESLATLLSDTGEKTAPDAGENTLSLKSRREIYDEFIKANKDFYVEDTQNIINRRFKEARETEEALKNAGSKIKELEEKLKMPDPIPPDEDFLKAHPDFELSNEMKNDVFRILYEHGISVNEAYCAAHHDSLIEEAKNNAHQSAVKATLDSVRARGVRVHESAAISNYGTTLSRDVSSLTRLERAEIARRVMAGESVSFS